MLTWMNLDFIYCLENRKLREKFTRRSFSYPWEFRMWKDFTFSQMCYKDSHMAAQCPARVEVCTCNLFHVLLYDLQKHALHKNSMNTAFFNICIPCYWWMCLFCSQSNKIELMFQIPWDNTE